jgi:hypothetical protein
MKRRKMNDYLFFLGETSRAIPLYEAIKSFICSEFEGVKVKASKTQISFSNRYGFAYVSLPRSRMKGRSDGRIILTFGLGYKLDNPRIMEAVEPYPRRWTHHVIIQSETEVDAQIKEWLSEAYHFSNAKRSRR